MMVLSQGVVSSVIRSNPRTPAIQPGTNYQQNNVQNRSLMGMGMNPMQMGGMNPMQMGGMNPMQQMGGMNPMQMGGMNPMQMGGMNPMQMQKNWSWGQNPTQNLRKSGISHQIR